MTARKRPLPSRIPRAYPDHRRLLARRYAAGYRAVSERFPGSPEDLRVQHAQVAATLADVANDLAAEDLTAQVGTQRQAREALRAKSRLRRQEIRLRGQLLAIEARLASLVPKPAAPTVDEIIARARALSQPETEA